MLNSKILLRLLIVVFFNAPAQTKRPYSIEILDFEVRTLHPHIDKKSVQTSFDRRHVNVGFTFGENITEWSAKFDLSILVDGSHPTSRLNLDVNICRCLRSRCRVGFVSTLLKEVFRTSNFARGCPLQANKHYFIKNYTVREDDYPMFLPKTMWQIQINMTFNRNPAMVGEVKGRVY